MNAVLVTLLLGLQAPGQEVAPTTEPVVAPELLDWSDGLTLADRDAREAFQATPWPVVRQTMGLQADAYYMFLLADDRQAFRHYMKLVAIERRRLAREAAKAAAQ